MTNKSAKKVSKGKRIILFATLPLLIIAIVYFLTVTYKEIKITFSLRKELKQTEETLSRLNEELENLQNEKEKLTDPNYVNAVARSKYNLTKVGEEVYSLEALED